MAEVTIREKTWHSLVAAARKRGKKPETLADEALDDFLQREADEALLEKSSRAAQKNRFTLRDTEEIIRKHRKRKASE